MTLSDPLSDEDGRRLSRAYLCAAVGGIDEKDDLVKELDAVRAERDEASDADGGQG